LLIKTRSVKAEVLDGLRRMCPQAETECDAKIRLGVHVTPSTGLVRGDLCGTGRNVLMEGTGSEAGPR
jgi:hypothetical protein